MSAGVVVVVVVEKMRRIARGAIRGAVLKSYPDYLKIPGITRQGCVVVVVIVFVVELVDVVVELVDVVVLVVLVVVGEAAAAGGANIKAKLGVRSRSVANP